MLKRQLIKLSGLVISLAVIVCSSCTYARESIDDELSLDRIQLVTQQLNLLKSRNEQAKREFDDLSQHEIQISRTGLEKAGKSLIDKAVLDISVSKSNLESINIELTDSQYSISWLEKNIQEIENQLNVLSIFGAKIISKEAVNVHELRSDADYLQKLLTLEKTRVKYLQSLQTTTNNILQLKNDYYNRLNELLKSRRMLHVKQEQVRDELAYQELQNHWLSQLNLLYARLAKVDLATSKPVYSAIERDIFYANENANVAYVQSLIARYNDQIEQMKLTLMKSNSITLLNEMSSQVQTLSKQISRLEAVLKSRMEVLEKHIAYLTVKKKNDVPFQPYLKKLKAVNELYKKSNTSLQNLAISLTGFRKTLDQAIQVELSSRQGLPTFQLKTLLDIGKEVLLVPALTFQIVKSMSTALFKAFETTGLLAWGIFIFAQSLLLSVFIFLRGCLSRRLAYPYRDKLSSKWLFLQFLQRHFIDVAVIGNALGVLFFFGVPWQSFLFVIALSAVWLIFKAIMTVSRLCLVETTHDTSGHAAILFKRLRWIILVGGIITGLTVFVHQLPLIYELSALCDRLFLFFTMIVSLLLLRSWDVVPNLIISHMESHHPYFQKVIRLFGFLIPALMLGNSVIGLLGFLNLVMTVSWYEGIFLLVLIGYLILRGLLSDLLEQLSHFVIAHVQNGWLWNEAFLKPIHKILRIMLFLAAWGMLSLLYKWDQQSPIVERLTSLLHYRLASVLNTIITPLNIIELLIVISLFYWIAKWTREFVYRMLLSRTKDMGIRNSIAILSQYCVIVLGAFFCLSVLGINLQALTFVASMFAIGIGFGLRDLINNFACGFLILLERPLRVGDIVDVNDVEGEVIHIGGRAVTIRTSDHMEMVVPNTEIFNKSFINWTARDNIIRCVSNIKIARQDDPHKVRVIIQDIVGSHKEILKEPGSEVYLKTMNDIMEFELRFYVNIRQVKSRISIISAVNMKIWDAFLQHGINPPYPHQEVFLHGMAQSVALLPEAAGKSSVS